MEKFFLILSGLYLIFLLVFVAYKSSKEEGEYKKKEEKRLASIPDTMPLFDPNSKCPVCITPNPYLRFAICGFQSSLGYSGEAIRKECRNCGYIWWEHTADFKGESRSKIIKMNKDRKEF